MKIFFILFISIVLSLPVLATVRTVSNNPTHPAQYTTFDAAQTASSAGDTIYVYGSPFTYPEIVVRKRLVLIGAGYAPNNQFGQPTNVSGLTFFRDSGSNNATGSVVSGFLFTNRVDLGGTLVSNNVQLFRNRFNAYINLSGASPTGYVDGWVIYNNIIDSYIYGGGTNRTALSATNIIIANNIFTSSAYLYGFNTNTALVDHNLFLGTSVRFNSLFSVIITNNIMVRTSGNVMTNTVLCTFNNNVCNQSTIGGASEYSPTNSFTATFIGSGGGSNSGSGNQVGVDPLFTSVSNFDTYNANFNYRLQASSPVKNGSTDGTDPGIYGGTYPYPSGGVGTQYDTAPMPAIPQVTAVNIQNATIQPNGTLNVQVQGKVNN